MKLFAEIASLSEARRPFVLATVVDTGGSSPQKSGARLVFKDDGGFLGTIGGGAVEQQVLEAAKALLADPAKRTRLLKTHLTHDLGMCCGGSMTVFLEKVLPAERLVVFGAGHVAKPLAAMAAMVGFEVAVVDEREEWLTADRFQGLERALAHPGEYARKLEGDGRTFVCVTTHDHQLDQEVVEALLDKPFAWVGMIGSQRKRERFRMRLEAKGFKPEAIARLRTPMGLPIDAQTPEEIAVSIVAELVAVRRGKRVSNAAESHPEDDAAKTA